MASYRTAFPALGVPSYRRFWLAAVASNIGSAMQGVALDWLVLETTHSGTAVGWTTGLQFAPVLVLGVWGGVLADRRDRRRLLLLAQSLYALQALVLAVVVLRGAAPLWLLYSLALGFGVVFAAENPARLSFVRDVVGPELITSAAGLNLLSYNLARLVGPALAGLLIPLIGTGGVFACNCASFSVVILTLRTLRSPAREKSLRPGFAGEGVAGLRYVLSQSELVAVFLLFGVVSMFGVTFPITLTLFAGRVFDVGSRGLGFLSTALAVGTIAGSLLAARRPGPTVRRVLLGTALFAGAELVTATAPTYASLLVLLVPTGVALMVLNTSVSGYVQTHVDEAMRGRVMAIYTVILVGGTPVGGPTIGWLSQHAGVRTGLATGATLCLAAMTVTALWLRRTPPAVLQIARVDARSAVLQRGS